MRSAERRMLPFKLVYSDAYYLPIGNHVFPAEKYRRVRDRLIAGNVADAKDFLEPEPATDQDILLVHKPAIRAETEDRHTERARSDGNGNSSLGRDLAEAFWLAAGGSISGGAPVLDRQGLPQHRRRISPRFSRSRRGILA